MNPNGQNYGAKGEFINPGICELQHFKQLGFSQLIVFRALCNFHVCDYAHVPQGASAITFDTISLSLM